MKKYEISIKKDEILEEVSLNTAYTGAKTGDIPGTFDKVATIEGDHRLLGKIWGWVCGEVIEKVREFIADSESAENELKIILEMSEAFDSSLFPSVVSDMKAAVAAGVSARWFGYSFPEKAGEWEGLFERLLQRAFSKLCHRRKPHRPKL